MFERWTELIATGDRQQLINISTSLQVSHIRYRTQRREGEPGERLHILEVRRRDLEKAKELIRHYL